MSKIGFVIPMAVVLMCLPFACAAPSGGTPREYYQPAPGTSPPPPLMPGAGAPVVGQPGYVGPVEGIPRTQAPRVLPIDEKNSREPGFWATETPRASQDEQNGQARPNKLYPPNPDPEDTTVGNTCTKYYRQATTKINKERDNAIAKLIESFTAEQHECFFVRLYARCINQLYAEREAERERILNDPNRGGIAPRSLQHFRNHVDALKQRACKGNLPWGAEQLLGLARKYMTDAHQNPEAWKEYK